MRSTAHLIGILSVVLLATACGGGGSPEAYFAELEAVTATLDAELDDLEAGFNAGILDIDFEAEDAERALISLFQASLTRTADSFARLVAGLRTIDPPSGIVDPHQEALQAGERVLAEYQEREEQLASLDTLADVDAYAAAVSAAGSRQRFVEACRELQTIADLEDIDAELGCS
jgi:outer membrane murein-binding lipoprotein Lpp